MGIGALRRHRRDPKAEDARARRPFSVEAPRGPAPAAEPVPEPEPQPASDDAPAPKKARRKREG